MQLGRLDEETTANVGVIEGGTATNVVPRSCRVEGEARSIDAARAAETVGAMSEACAWGAGRARLRRRRADRGGVPRLPDAASLARRWRWPSAGCGGPVCEPQRAATGGGSDANAHVAAGFDCLLLANGTEGNHTAAGERRRPQPRPDARGLRGDRRGGAGC